MNILNEEMQRVYERALALCEEDYQWENLGGQRVTLKVLSRKEKRWNTYWLTDDTCSCQNWKFCYHLAKLQLSGGVAGVKIRLHIQQPHEPKGNELP